MNKGSKLLIDRTHMPIDGRKHFNLGLYSYHKNRHTLKQFYFNTENNIPAYLIDVNNTPLSLIS